jgi:hypothetical protein
LLALDIWGIERFQLGPKHFLRSYFQLSIPIFSVKTLFSKNLQELPLVVLQLQEKNGFSQKRISISLWARQSGFELIFQ